MSTDRKVIKKRRFPRRKFHRNVGYLYKGQYNVVECVQIGEGGMMVYSPHAHQKGDCVVVSFMVPGRDFIICRAMVQYPMQDQQGRTLYGMRFIDISFEYRRMLRDFISAKTEDEARQEGVFTQSDRTKD